MLYKLSGCDTGNFMKISPSGGAVAITYLGEEPVYVGIGMAFHDFHHIIDTEIRDVFDERLSDITAESFAYIALGLTRNVIFYSKFHRRESLVYLPLPAVWKTA